jgi:hypothetical protein
MEMAVPNKDQSFRKGSVMLICMHIIVSQLIILVLQSQINTSELSCVVCGAFYIYQFTVERFQMIPNDLGVLIDFTREANGRKLSSEPTSAHHKPIKHRCISENQSAITSLQDHL